LSMEEYLPIVAARESPESRGEARTDAIESIEFAGPVTSLARVRCSIGPKCFTDLLVEVLDKNPATTFVVIDEVEVEDWGIGGLPVEDYRRGHRGE
jgi:Tautomerase enzyme/Putative lumazine-binding